MNTLKYKGFIGSIRFNDEEGLFSGKIEGIDSLIRFEGSSIQELTEAFHKAVDDYLDFCKKEGIPSKKSYSGTLNIRISPATHNSIADFAAEEGITINAFIKRALEKAVQNPAEIIKSLVDGYDQIQSRHDHRKLPVRAVRAVGAFRPATPDLIAVAAAVVARGADKVVVRQTGGGVADELL